MTYKKVILKDIALFNQQTYNKKYNWEYAYYLDTGSITENSINQLVYYDLKSHELPSRARRIPKKNSILYSTVRPNQKHFGFLKDIQNNLIVSTGFAVIDVDSTKADPKYVYYYLIQQKIIDYLQSIAEGSVSTYPTIKPKVLKELEIIIPDKSIQYKVVNILSSLDQKIEVNNKIIANLEEQAQAIFKSWFVDFDPFQNEEFIESELGMIPKGWEIGALGNSSLGKLMGSGIDKFEGEKIYLATADVVDTSIINLDTKVSFNHRPSRANMQPEPLSVWFAKMKDSRKLILVNESDAFIYNNMIFSTGFAGIKATPYSVYYLWTYLLTEEFNLIKDSYCQGTTMQAINNKNINKISIKIPPEPVLKEFSDITKPMFELISKLTQQNQTLSELRDALLPKLMSGEIDVSQISVEDEVDES